jgi:hypothetical protein
MADASEDHVLCRGAEPEVERRAHLRAHLDVPVLLDALRSHHTGRCRNVSVGGMAVATDAELPVGTELELYFELPSGVAVETRAAVLRSAPSEVALEFLALSPECRLALRAHCRRLAQPSSAVMRAARPVGTGST